MSSPRKLAAAAAALAVSILLAGAPAGAEPPLAGNELVGPPPPPPLDPLATIHEGVGYEADGGVEFLIELDAPAAADTTVHVSISDGTTDSDDHDHSPDVPVVPAGETTATLFVLMVDDGVVEDPENFTVHLNEGDGYRVNDSSKATGTLLDGDGPQLDILETTQVEGDTAAGNVLLATVQASYAPIEDLAFRIFTANIGFEAVAGEDYHVVDQMVTLPAGETTVSVPVAFIGDELVEDDELFFVFGESPSAGTFGLNGGTAVMGIVDDDEPGDGAPGDGEPQDEPGDDEPGDDQPGDDQPGDDEPDSPTTTGVEEDDEPAEVLADGVDGGADGLPVTGVATGLLAALGAVAVAVGVAVRRTARRLAR